MTTSQANSVRWKQVIASAGAGLAVACALWLCQPSARGGRPVELVETAERPNEPPEATPAPDCVVAEWEGGALTRRDVAALRAAVLPPPARDEQDAWAIDVTLAAREEGAGAEAPAVRVHAYRAWLERKAAEPGRSVAMASLRREARLAHGPCFGSSASSRGLGGE
jgi:hypothetical protein